MNTTRCPIKATADKTTKSARYFNQELRRLRKATETCKSCATSGDGPILIEFNSQVEQAITKINEEALK